MAKNKTALIKLFNTVLVLIAIPLFSCQGKSVTPGAERIRVLDAEPKGCLYMGEVSTVQDNEDTVVSGKEVEMNLNSRIDLRNKAFTLSGNALVFMSKNKAKLATTNTTVVDTAKKDSKPAESKASEPEKIAQTVFLGTVFRCPPTIINQ